jgi:hypothetical protein
MPSTIVCIDGISRLASEENSPKSEVTRSTSAQRNTCHKPYWSRQTGCSSRIERSQASNAWPPSSVVGGSVTSSVAM